MRGNRGSLGALGETAASRALKARGYRILEKNYRCPLGEIDLIARAGSTLVFVEVKSETSGSRVLPKARVDHRKQRKLLQLAQYYLKEKNLEGVSARFDVVQVRLQAGESPVVDIIENAFEARSR